MGGELKWGKTNCAHVRTIVFCAGRLAEGGGCFSSTDGGRGPRISGFWAAVWAAPAEVWSSRLNGGVMLGSLAIFAQFRAPLR